MTLPPTHRLTDTAPVLNVIIVHKCTLLPYKTGAVSVNQCIMGSIIRLLPILYVTDFLKNFSFMLIFTIL
ncbi:MAG: hypothetical protein K0S04_1141 [Herbinix sp.]|nr:hypothetical protein [Herbinix sp.]